MSRTSVGRVWRAFGLKPRLAEKFAEVDTDKDGKLSAAELTVFKASHHGKGRGEGHAKDEARG